MIRNTSDTYYADIFIGTNPGYDNAENPLNTLNSRQKVIDVCDDFVQKGLCVTIQDVEYVYTGGKEFGYKIQLIQYPRFPKPEFEILLDAVNLAHILMDRLIQFRCTIITPTKTYLLENENMPKKYQDKA